MGQWLRLPPHFHARLLPFARIFPGVGKQVHEDLRERVAVAVHEQRRRRQIAFEFEAGGFQMGAVTFHCFPHDVGEIAFREVVFLFAAFQA